MDKWNRNEQDEYTGVTAQRRNRRRSEPDEEQAVVQPEAVTAEEPVRPEEPAATVEPDAFSESETSIIIHRLKRNIIRNIFGEHTVFIVHIAVTVLIFDRLESRSIVFL